MRRSSVVAGLAILGLGVGLGAQSGTLASPSLLKTRFDKLPVCFVENRGVYPEEVKYYIQGADKTLFFTEEGITYRLGDNDRSWVVKLDFMARNPQVVPHGEDRQQAVVSYFRGKRENWNVGLLTFAKVVYRNLWPGIDLVYRGSLNQLKYEFVVAPGANPASIRLRYRGACSIKLTDTAALRIETPNEGFEDAPPIAWQTIDGRRMPVDVGYRLGRGGADKCATFGFEVGAFDRTRPLVVDPATILYCGYIGGAGDDRVCGIAVDPQGNAYVVGWTRDSRASFPTRVGPGLSYGGDWDAFVAKIDSTGQSLVYCGYVGGAADDYGSGIAVDYTGAAYVAGRTYSNSAAQMFPATIGPDLTHNGQSDAFVAKINSAGTALTYCGYVGGTAHDGATAIAVDVQGNAYIAGFTDSPRTSFPAIVGPDLTHNGQQDAFVAKINPTGTALVYCGYVGGSADDSASAIATDGLDRAILAGRTRSTPPSFPVRYGPNLTYAGGEDAFVARVDQNGKSLEYCGYIGGASDDIGTGVAVDASGSAFVVGQTSSTEATFPTKVGPGLSYSQTWDAFVAKVNPTGALLDSCGYIGGVSLDVATGVAVDWFNDAYVVGWTYSTEQSFPVVTGPEPTHHGGFGDAFIAKMDGAKAKLIYCGYLGGGGSDGAHGVAVDRVGGAYVVGLTQSPETSFPVKAGPDLSYNGKDDGFVAKVAFTNIEGRGSTRPGGTITLYLTASDSPGRYYQVGSSLGTGPISIGTRRLPLSPDTLLLVSTGGYWPSVFRDYRGQMDMLGRANASIDMPKVFALVGIRFHTAFVTVDSAAPLGIRSISNALTVTITSN